MESTSTSASGSPSSVDSDQSSSASTSSSPGKRDNFYEEMSSKIGSNVEGIDIEEPLQYDNYNVFDLSNDSSELLHETSDLSISQSLAMLFNWFCSYPSISKECFDRLLYLLHSFFLPTGNKLPMSYAKARDMIKDALVPVHSCDSCVNDCIVYRDSAKGKLKGLTSCPVCFTGRYQPHTSIARKRFKYIPLAPRLKRMFSDKKISELLREVMGANLNRKYQICINPKLGS